ncbi:MAG: helix-turn-helix domain-containing protein [Micromonosporaceae bacterium]
MTSDFIGARVRHWRLKRGLSQKVLGELAGVTQGYISQIESGLKEVDKRSTLVRLAEALQVSGADLTDLAGPEFPERTAADATIPAIRAALNVVRLGDSYESSRALPQLRADVDRLSELRKRGRYDVLGGLLPDLLLDLHGVAGTPHREADRREALRLMVRAAYCTTYTLKYLHYSDLAMIAAELCHAAAQQLDEPVWRGLSDFTRIHSLPVENKTITRRLAVEAADRLTPYLDDKDAQQAYGMLQLSAALTSAVCERDDDARSQLAEAAEMAERTGEGDFAQMHFGPTNVGFWRAAIAVEMGEGGRIREIAKDIRPETVDSSTRQAAFFIDVGRALAQTRKHDREAINHLLRAERLAPQRVRLDASVRDTVGAMLRRAQARAGGEQLQSLAARVGVV